MKIKINREGFAKIRLHNKNVMAGDAIGIEAPSDIREFYEGSFEKFVSDVMKTRMGLSMDGYGRRIAPFDISLDNALKHYYGVDMKTWLKQMDIYIGSDTLNSVAQRFGASHLSNSDIERLMIDHTKFSGGINSTPQINGDFRFIIPELILAPIRIDYESSSFAQNWIASTTNISQREIKMPQIKRSASVPRRIGEAESIPFGTVQFGQKTAKVFKIGTGFKITDELVDASSIDLMFQFLGDVGTDMAIGKDVEALNILVNGEQTDGSESAPIVGTIDGSSFAYKDIKRVSSRMTRLRHEPNRLLTGEDDAIDISGIDKFEGFDGQTRLAEFRSIVGVPSVLDNDVYTMPDNQIMYLNSSRCMTMLQYKGLTTETRRNPQTQEDEVFISDHVGFAILRRDARVIQDKTLEFSSNGFPSYMDIDSRIAQGFKGLN